MTRCSSVLNVDFEHVVTFHQAIVTGFHKKSYSAILKGFANFWKSPFWESFLGSSQQRVLLLQNKPQVLHNNFTKLFFVRTDQFFFPISTEVVVRRYSVKKRFLTNFAKLTGNHLCQSLFVSKVAGLRQATLLKKKLVHRHLPVNFCEILKNTFFLHNISFGYLCWLTIKLWALLLLCLLFS